MSTKTTSSPARDKGHSAYIGNLTVRSKFPVIVYGQVRGLVSEHRNAHAAAKSLRSDQRGCKSQGGYSDASIYVWEESEGWVAVEADGH